MFEKLKHNWKKIVLMVVGGYLGITIIASAFGYESIKKKKQEMENHETEIGKEFESRKNDFYEQFYANAEETLSSMKAHFAASEKRSDQNVINGMRRTLKSMSAREADPDHIEEDMYYLSMAEEAFEKKWTPKQEKETDSQYERRVDEGHFDWDQIRLERKEAMRKWPGWEASKNWIRIEEARDLFVKRKQTFFAKYDDDYKGILGEEGTSSESIN